MKLVSIVMPAYNAERYIAIAIDSVIAQTYSNWELWVVDDGSTDTTRYIVEKYNQRDKRVRYIYQSNSRQGAARNNGIIHATGSLIAFLDSDDFWLPHKLTVQVKQIETSRADLVFSDAYIFNTTFEANSTHKVLHSGVGRFYGQEGFAKCLLANPVPILTVLVTKKALVKAGNFSEELRIQNAEDYHLWLRMLLTGSILIGYPDILAAYRELNTSISGIDRLNIRQAIEAKAELAQNFPFVRPLIEDNLNNNIRVALDKSVYYSCDDFFNTVNRYLIIFNRNNWFPLFKLYHIFKMHKIAIRSIYFIFNHL